MWHPHRMAQQPDQRSAEAEAARQRALDAHAGGERNLGKIAKAAGRGESQTSRYLSDAGLSCNDPVPGDVAPAGTGSAAGADGLTDLSYGEPAEHTPVLPPHTTPNHLRLEVFRALGLDVAFSDNPKLVFKPVPEPVSEPFLDADGWPDADRPHCTAGASQIGTAEWREVELPVLMVHHRADDGTDRYQNAGDPLTGWAFVVPEYTFDADWEPDEDDPARIEDTVGVVLAGTLEEAAEAVLGVWPDDGQCDGWNLFNCRFSEAIDHWEEVIFDNVMSGRQHRLEWTFDEDTVMFEAAENPEAFIYNAQYGLTSNLDVLPYGYIR